MAGKQKNIPEIKWRWSTEKEDVHGVDIVGEIDEKNKDIWLQVKLVSGARIGFGDIDFERIIMLYIKNDDGIFYLVPKNYEGGLIAYFVKIYCDVMAYDFIDYLKKRKLKI